jgi:threonine dehydrogenase-like Zn-dependent dehydrogenase
VCKIKKIDLIFVQGAKLAGCTVIGTCGSADKAKMLCGLGCDVIINHRSRDVKEAVLKRYPEGVDLVIEHVGGKVSNHKPGTETPSRPIRRSLTLDSRFNKKVPNPRL